MNPHANHRPFSVLVLFVLAALLFGGCSMVEKSHLATPDYTTGNPAPVVKTAASQIGIPYRWGGDTPKEGFDCSGLVQWVYSKHGVKLPRGSWQQIQTGTPVGRSQIVAGDVVFFKLKSGRGYHVGIATGRGTFIHAPRSGQRVKESDMHEGYWRDNYVATRRYLPAGTVAGY